MRALTPEQEQAVARRRGPLLLAAGAGSGKTAVLVERFVRAIREDGIAPGRIVAITFTERAAAELRERIRARLLELGEREAARDTEGAPIGTFHGFCARLLRVHALTAGLDPEFAILDETAAARLRGLAFRAALAALLAGERRDAVVELLAAYGADRVRAMLLGVYAEQRSRGMGQPMLPTPAPPTPALTHPELAQPVFVPAIPGPAQEPVAGAARPETVVTQPTLFEWEPIGSPSQLADADPREREAIAACAVLGELLERFGRGYSERKRARAALDFDDLELLANDLLHAHEGVRRRWSERIELLMVDEFQDTNRRQLKLLELLERDNLFTVGDELQSIYGFRHAEVEIFRARRRRLQREDAVLALIYNFRSRASLLAAINSLFGERFGETYTPLVAGRDTRPQDDPAVELLLTDRGGWAQSPHAGHIAGALPPATLWRQAEARMLAQRIAELVAAGQAQAGEVAVLVRAATDLPLYEQALEERGLRTLAAVGSFWGHQQVGDLLAWLRVLANPLDELAFYSVLASPLVGISGDGLALIAMRARAAALGVWAAIAAGEELYAQLEQTDGERLRHFAEYFAAERRVAATLSPAELLVRAIASAATGAGTSGERRSPVVGYEQHVLTLPAGERRMANIHKLVRLARRFEATEGRDLRGFLDHVAHRRDLAESAEPHAPTGSEPNAVRLMTIHAAKGLEFPVVCIADLGRTPNGGAPDLLVDGERVGLRLARLDGSAAVACLHYEELCEERRHSETAEEDRILYVAMTRARDRLLLSGACDFGRWAKGRQSPIDWLAPALVPELPALVQTLEQPVAELPMAGDGRVRVRCLLNSAVTVGRVLRPASDRSVLAT